VALNHIYAILAALAGMGMLVAPPATADDAKMEAYGRHLSRECTACHRIDGTDNGIPSIVGWDKASFAETMEMYKSGARSNPAMGSVAQSLDEEQIKSLAQYFSTLPVPARRNPAPTGPTVGAAPPPAQPKK